MSFFLHIATFFHSLFKSHRRLTLENLALRQQLAMLKPSVKRPQVSPADRLFWILFSKYVDGWRTMLHALHPDTVVRWHREGFRLYWTWKSRRQCVGRPHVDNEIRKLVWRQLSWPQLVEAFPFDSAPRYLLRDRDAIYGEKVQRRIKSLGIEEVVTAPRSPWQNPFVERIIGSIRRDCLDHIIVLNERHLRRILREYFSYYHTCRTHLSLNKDPPESRKVEPPAMGNIAAFPRVGGLHHRYARIAA